MNETENNTDDLNCNRLGNSQPELHRLSTARLFKGTRELIIEHAGEEYRLRITGKGKLILTK